MTNTVSAAFAPTSQAFTAPDADAAKRAKITDAAQQFEASFLSVMFQEMFSGIKSDGPFGGGAGEDMFKSFMAEAMAKQVAKTGGLGLSDTVAREMLKMQGLQ